MKFEDPFLQLLYDSNQLKEEYITEKFLKDLYWYDLKNIVNLFSDNERICLEAVKKDGWTLKYVKKQTGEMCLIAVKKDKYVLKYVNQEFKEICEQYLKENDFLQICISTLNRYFQ